LTIVTLNYSSKRTIADDLAVNGADGMRDVFAIPKREFEGA
jgi:hypothetical protein